MNVGKPELVAAREDRKTIRFHIPLGVPDRTDQFKIVKAIKEEDPSESDPTSLSIL